MPFPLIHKLEKLLAVYPGDREADQEIIRKLQLSDEVIDLIDDITDAAKNEFGNNLPSPRESSIMSHRGFTVKFVESAKGTGLIPCICTPVGRISY